MVRKAKAPAAPSNFISEWFGHRVFPEVRATPVSMADQKAGRCPFLSKAVDENRDCIKGSNAKGVCTISSVSNGPRQDWLACPYRALSDALVIKAIRRLFEIDQRKTVFFRPAITLKRAPIRAEVSAALNKGTPVFIYFDQKTGGELSIPGTDKSPEFSFDVTVLEIRLKDGLPHIGRFGIIEIQTADFHGSYREAVRNLTDGLRMHKGGFGRQVQKNTWWLSEHVEGPNIANVFKRTFYQMMFKFQLGMHEQCAGCILAIPQSVWDSWQRHLGAPVIHDDGGGLFSLRGSSGDPLASYPAHIFVFDTDPASPETPSPIVVRQVIRTDSAAFSYWALDVAPNAALSNIAAETGFFAGLSRRLKPLWPELARTAVAEIPIPVKGRKPRGETKVEVSLVEAEAKSSYKGPTVDAVRDGLPDEG